MFSGSQNPKRVISDIRPAGSAKKGPRLIPGKREPNVPPPRHEPLPPRKESVEQHHSASSHRRVGLKHALLLVGAVVLIGFSVWWSSTLTLAITREQRDFNLGAGIPLSIPAKEFSTEVVERGEGVSTNVEAFNNRASGKIVVYNNYSSEPQVLVARTRFQTPAGLIFRSNERVVVPGKKGEKPGSVEVTITADEPGEKYNVGKSDFKIPGFAGTPKYDKFYGRSHSDEAGDIKGGAAGQGKVVGKAEAEALLKSLKEKVSASLASKLTSEVPAPFVIFPNTIEITITLEVTDPPIGAPGDRFFGEVRGRARVLAVDRSVYEKALAESLFEDKSLVGAYVLPADARLSCETPKLNYEKSTIACSVQGKALFQGVVPVDELRQKILSLQGVSETDALYKQYPGIKKVEQTFRPGFLKRIPSREGQIVIQVR